MKVLMLGWELPPHNSGGLGVACRGLARALHEEGVDVLFMLPRRAQYTENWARFLFADSSRVFDEEFVHSLHSGYTSVEQYAHVRQSLGFSKAFVGWGLLDEVWWYAGEAAKLVKKEAFDVIHAHDWLTFPAALAIKRSTGKPLVVHMHATEFDRTGFGSVNQLVYDIERRAMHEANAILAVSAYTKKIAVERYGVDPDKVFVVHNGIDSDDAAVSSPVEHEVHALKEEGNAIVLFVGRITLQKGPDYFLEAAKKVLDHTKKVRFVFSGAGDMQESIMQQAAFLGIADKVSFVGFLRNGELARMYQMADVVVMPSVSEPFGIVPLEALLNETPVIVSKQSGVAEVLKGALKVDFWDTEAMADQMLAVVTHRSLNKTIATQGKAEVMRMWWKLAAKKCMSVYTDITGVGVEVR